MKDIKSLLDTKYTYDVGKRVQHLACDPSLANRTFNNRQVSQVWENPKNYRNVKQFDAEKRKFEVGMWVDVRDTIG